MTQQQPNQNTDTTAAPEIVARAGRYYRNTRYLIFVLFLGFGLWCIRDGFSVWPEANAKAIKAGLKVPYTDLDIQINRGLGLALPVFSVLVLLRTLYNSRGAYRLSGDTLFIPGHPPIPLSAIRKIDKRLWDRKGIAYVEYEVPGSSGVSRFTLDDFVYARTPTDQIFERIESHAQSVAQQS